MNNTQTGAEQSSTPIENSNGQGESLNDKWSHKIEEPYFGPDRKASGEEHPRQTFSLEDLESLRIKSDTIIPERKIVVRIGDAAFAADCNLSAISAAAKAGKSALCGAILSGCFSHDGSIDGFPNIHVLPNHSNKAVLHIDTEQSDDDQKHMVTSIGKRAGRFITPDNFYSYNFRMANFDVYYEMTESACRELVKVHGGIHLIVIDGGADFITSVNDEEQSKEVVDFFTRLSVEYECPVIVIVHLNPSTINTKERGHFGSTLQRKCYGLIAVTKDGDTSKIDPRFMRKASVDDIPDIFFKYSKEHGYHVETGGEQKKDVKSEKKLMELQELADDVLQGQKSLIHKELVEAIMVKLVQSKSTAKKKIEEMVTHGFIHLGGGKRYRLGSGSEKVKMGQDLT